ncbi:MULTISPECIES: hypothetical protein [Komagataeibacter]|nr:MULTISPECIES: hypothetical protein [Komagataeibacter]WEQ54150.1 hypothetical protein LV478_18645 [Komagataeibacter oboediens]
MMVKPKKASALAGIFEEESAPVSPTVVAESMPKEATTRSRLDGNAPSPRKKNSHPGKKPVLIHIPEDMHRTLRQLSVEEGGEPLTVITERLLRQYLVQRGHTRFAP